MLGRLNLAQQICDGGDQKHTRLQDIKERNVFGPLTGIHWMWIHWMSVARGHEGMRGCRGAQANEFTSPAL